MTLKAPLIFLIILSIIISCKKGNTGAQGIQGNIRTGDIQGFVNVYDCYGNYQNNRAGVLVSLNNSSIVAITDSMGKYILKDVPINTYNIFYTKQGYGINEIRSFQFVGGPAIGVVKTNSQLIQLPTYELDSLHVSEDSIDKSLNLSGVFNILGSNNCAYIFIGHNADVSSNPATYSEMEDIYGVNSKSFSYSSYPGLSKDTSFKRGTKAYAVGYSRSALEGPSQSYDSATGKVIYNTLGKKPTKVVQFKVY